MKNTIIKSFLILSATAFAAVGCIKETFPEDGSVTAAQVASSASALEAMLNSIPAAMVATNTAGYLTGYDEHFDFGIGAIHLMTENMLEDFVTLADNPYYNRNYPYGMCQYQDDRHIFCAYFWDCYFPWIKTCNDIISSVRASGEEPIASVAPILGKAYAYRANFYLDLARMFEFKKNKYFDRPELEGLTVPIINEKTKETDANNNPRAKRDSMYNFILSDLDFAEKYLDNASNNVYEPGIDVVNGLRARAYLEMGASGVEGAYAKAADYAQKVIDAGYKVLTQAQWEDPVNGFNNASANGWVWGLGITAENFNNICTYAAFLCSEGQWGYAPLAQYGASKSFYESISNTDFRKHSWLDPKRSEFYNYKFAGTEINGKEFLSGNSNVPAAKDYEHIKFRPAGGNCTDYNVGNATDIPMMRVEEMYFIKAEALAYSNLSSAQTALEDIVKTRDPNYSCGGNTLENFLEELLFQKRIEFWGEGVLFFDYKRLDHGITRGYTGTNWPTDWCFNSEGRSPQWNFVITRAETQSNTGIPESLNNPDPSSFVPLWTDAE